MKMPILTVALAALAPACTALEGLTDVPGADVPGAFDGGEEASQEDGSPDAPQLEASPAEASPPDEGATEDAPSDEAKPGDADGAETGDASMDAPTQPPPTLTVRFSAIGAGESGAAISSTPAGISCSAAGGTCTSSATFPWNSTVRLTVSGIGATSLSAWSPSMCTGSECTVTMSATQGVSYQATGNNLVFATGDHTGNLGGLAGAKAICTAAASSAGLPGHYVPWLATTTVNATTALGSARGWIRPDGLPFADTVGTKGGTTGFINGQIFYPAALDEQGAQATQAAWTGSNPDGSAYQSNVTCADWTSATAADTGNEGDPTYVSTGYLSLIPVPCDHGAAVYCFGTDLTTPVTVTPQPGRVAFTSKGALSGSAGLAAADALCQSEATSASLPNAASFVALLATSSASAASRLSASGQNWVRSDGLPLATSAASLLAGQILVTPFLHADGTMLAPGTMPWAGATTIGAVGTAASTCDDWTSSSSSLDAPIGVPQSVDAYWFGGSAIDCGQQMQVYCFER